MTAPTAHRLTSTALADFLIAQGLAAAAGDTTRALPSALPFEGKIPDLPDRVYLLAFTGGPGFQVERAIDVQSFQIRTRGMASIGGKAPVGSSDAEDLAWAVDDLLMHTGAGLIGDCYVNLIDRVGGPPTFFMRDPKGRVHFTGNYLFYVARIPA